MVIIADVTEPDNETVCDYGQEVNEMLAFSIKAAGHNRSIIDLRSLIAEDEKTLQDLKKAYFKAKKKDKDSIMAEIREIAKQIHAKNQELPIAQYNLKKSLRQVDLLGKALAEKVDGRKAVVLASKQPAN